MFKVLNTIRDRNDLRAESECEFSLASELIADEALTLHLGDAKTLVKLGEDNLHHERIARNDGSAELDAIDASEEEFLLRTTRTYINASMDRFVSNSILLLYLPRYRFQT